MRTWPVLLLLAGCTPQLSSSEDPIIGGTRSTGMTATVMLVSFPPDRSVMDTCTAVLVSPTVLLTSAHCVDAPNHPGYLYGVFTGDDATAYPRLVDIEPHLVPVSAVHPHPMYSTQAPFYADLGVVVLAMALPITPLPIQRTPLDSSVIGKTAQIVGYGQTTYQQINRARYEATTTVTAIENDTVVVGDPQHRACLGDSGGPAIVEGVLIGVDSYGPTGCTAAAHYRRVDSFLPFIDQYAPPPAGPGPDAGPGGGGPDAGDGETAETTGCATTGGGGPGGAGVALALALLARRRVRT
ncbi:MAG: Vitamin K-dependent protein [Myxococcales bacterium]|nr:Vitamin K-dependent protein [Myxococcales bacterium]